MVHRCIVPERFKKQPVSWLGESARTSGAVAGGGSGGSNGNGGHASSAPAEDSWAQHYEHAQGGSSRQAVSANDKIVKELQDKGEFVEACKFMEVALLARRDAFGAESPEVHKAAEIFVITCNMLAVEHLGVDSMEISYNLLKKCETFLEPNGFLRNEPLRLKLLAITMNNFGAFYSRRDKPHAALHYLKDALRIETMLGEADSPACTHINLCAVLSKLGRHEEAVDHIQCAIELLLSEITRGRNADAGSSGKEAMGAMANARCTLPVAYHNLGVEQEFLGRLDQATASYLQACRTAEDRLGEDHPVTVQLRLSYAKAEESIRNMW